MLELGSNVLDRRVAERLGEIPERLGRDRLHSGIEADVNVDAVS